MFRYEREGLNSRSLAARPLRQEMLTGAILEPAELGEGAVLTLVLCEMGRDSHAHSPRPRRQEPEHIDSAARGGRQSPSARAEPGKARVRVWWGHAGSTSARQRYPANARDKGSASRFAASLGFTHLTQCWDV